MACCQLAEVPTAAFQAVLHLLSSQDHASLRQVSRSVCQTTTQHVPYIIMRLLNSSSTDQLQHWFEATRRLQHVATVHIRLAGEISAEVFDMAMQLLAERFGNIKQLHLLNASSDSAAKIQTLQPIKNLLPRLKTLVLTGFEVSQHGMPWELKQLAAVAAAAQAKDTPWPLQSLVLTAEWSSGRQYPAWSEFPTALYELAKAFPRMRHFEIKLPSLEYDLIKGASAETSLSFNPPGKSNTYWQALLVHVAVVTSVFNAAQQMNCLESLSLVEFPDIWDPDMGSEPAAVVIAATAPAAAAAAVDASLDGWLPSLRAAAEAFITMDDCGMWLLQHHAALKDVHYSTMSREHWSMSWRQQQHQTSSSSYVSSSCAVTSVATATCAWFINSAFFESARAWDFLLDSDGSSSARLMNESSVAEYTQKLAHYSSRPVSTTMRHIISCNLDLQRDSHIEGLADLLGGMKSLKHLEVSLPNYDDIEPAKAIAAADKAIAAAANVHGLQSLYIDSLELRLHDDLLLPLTVAAGGPGSSLKSLKLLGGYAEAPANQSSRQPHVDRPASTEAEATTARKAATSRLLDESSRPKGPLKANASGVQEFTDDFGALSIDHVPTDHDIVGCLFASAIRHNPFTALQHLSELNELIISSLGGASSFKLYVELLPPTLSLLEATDLTIVSMAEAHCTAHQSAVCATASEEPQLPNGSTRVLDVEPALKQTRVVSRSCLSLRKLHLRNCQLSTPSVLVSTQLQELESLHTSWSGGWVAAAAAWPNVRKLTWSHPRNDVQLDWSSDSHGDGSISAESAHNSGDLSTATSSWTTVESDFECNAEATMHPMSNTSDSQHSDLDPAIEMRAFVEELSNGFPHIRTLALRGLPYLSVELLQPLVQHMKYLERVELGVNRLYKMAMPTCSYSSGASCEGKGYDAKAVQHWLQQQLPRARVVVT